MQPVVLYVDDDPGWLNCYIAKLAAEPGSSVRDPPTAAAYLAAERDLTLDLLGRWSLGVLPAAAADYLLHQAHSVITELLRAERG